VSEGDPGASVLVRAAKSPADWQAVRSLCCRTGNGGDPIDPTRWPLFAELWIGPYQRLVPEWTYVAEMDGRMVGYLTGCPDTAAFRRASGSHSHCSSRSRAGGSRGTWMPGERCGWPCASIAAWNRASPRRSPRGSRAPTPPTCT